MTIRLEQIVAQLPNRHRAALSWFVERAGTVQSWPDPLNDGTLLATKAKGIYKPEWSSYALSVRQTIGGPYPDKDPMIRGDGTWVYAYYQEGDFPQNRDNEYTNRALMACMRDAVPVGVMRQVAVTPRVKYQVLGAALVAGWDGGYFYLEGFSPDGHALEPGPRAEVQFISVKEEAALYQAGHFDPDNVNDARQRTLRAVVTRQGQAVFRQQLLQIYNGKCAVTGCSVLEILEAAHITPYLGPDTNHPSNGLLLRADLHTLFDLGLLAVDPNELRVRVAPAVQDNFYRSLHGIKVFVPQDEAVRPSYKALSQHRDWSGL